MAVFRYRHAWLFASSLDQIGPITRDVTVREVTICGKDEHDSTSAPVEVLTPKLCVRTLKACVSVCRNIGEGLDPKVHAELKK